MTSDIPSPFRFNGNKSLEILDQTRLPHEELYIPIDSLDRAVEAIHKLRVRGAPALGAAGALMLASLARDWQSLAPGLFLKKAEETAWIIGQARPTAVNLSWGINRALRALSREFTRGGSAQELASVLADEAAAIFEEDRLLCQRMGEHGANLILPGMGILTHCNAGALATCGIGTATAPLYKARDNNIPFRVFADETRPLLQGSRLTAWELMRGGIDVTVICDNMAAALLSTGQIDLVITGADRIAANGDAANKIGTLGLAILCRHFDVPFYIAAPYSTFDSSLSTGNDIPIEIRGAEEVLGFSQCRTAPESCQAWNPSFDVTPGTLITGFITEKGILSPPWDFSLMEIKTTP